MTSVKLPEASNPFIETNNKGPKTIEKSFNTTAKPNFAGIFQGSCAKKTTQPSEEKVETTNATVKNSATFASDKIKAEKPETLDEEQTDKVKEEVAQFNSAILQLVENVLGISSEAIQQFLQTNDMVPMDLLQPGNLALLASGAQENIDIMDLLNNGDFQQLLGEVDTLGKQLMETSGFSIKELSGFSIDLGEVAQLELPQELQREPIAKILSSNGEIGQSKLDEASQNVTKIPNGQSQEIQLPVEGPILNHIQEVTSDEQEVVIPILNAEMVQEGEGEPEALLNQIVEEVVLEKPILANTANQQEMDSNPNAKQSQVPNEGKEIKTDFAEPMENKVNLFSMNQKLDTLPVLDKAQNLPTIVNIQEVIDQIGEYAKLSVGNQVSTMEMQLNPENLGKLFVTITSHNGEITARIAAQTQLAKEVIDSQISQFRENLGQNGIKVEAVEVTVSTHEFEQNLDGNRSMMNQEQQEKKQPKRRMMNGNEFTLGNIQGLMSEEDQVVARMMKENGNTLDYQI